MFIVTRYRYILFLIENDLAFKIQILDSEKNGFLYIFFHGSILQINTFHLITILDGLCKNLLSAILLRRPFWNKNNIDYL